MPLLQIKGMNMKIMTNKFAALKTGMLLGAILCFFGACSFQEKQQEAVTTEKKLEDNTDQQNNTVNGGFSLSDKVPAQPYDNEIDKPEEINNLVTEQSNNEPIKTEQSGQETIPSVESPDMPRVDQPTYTESRFDPILTLPVPGDQEHPSAATLNLSLFWEILQDTAAAGQEYYADNFNRTRVISKDGYLYNKSSETTIDINYLCDKEGLHPRSKQLDIKVLLMYGSDLENIEGATIMDVNRGLTVFAAVKHPYEDKYLITSSNRSVGIVSGIDYRALLSNYNQNHGSIRRLSSGSEEYERILNFIRMYESKYEQYYVRSIFLDSKYAMVTLSSVTAAADVRQYILVKDGSFWEVVLDKLENEPRVLVAVNKKLPDFNLSMLPAYSVYDYRNNIRKSFTELLDLMIQENQIGSAADVFYVSGADRYAYVVTHTGVKFLCTYNDEWIIERVVDEYEASNSMTAISTMAPTFILLDD